MYIAALRIADDFGCDAIGIQYQQGLKDLAPARDLAEGTAEQRRTVRRSKTATADACFTLAKPCRISTKWTNALAWMAGDQSGVEGAGLSAGEHAARSALWRTDIQRRRLRLGASDFRRGPARAFYRRLGWDISERQPPMYFRLGGGTLKGVSKPGEIVWSRVFIEDGKLKADLGRAPRRSNCRRKKPNAAGPHHPAMAHHACRISRRQPRPNDGAAQSQSHPSGLCAKSRRCQNRTGSKSRLLP